MDFFNDEANKPKAKLHRIRGWAQKTIVQLELPHSQMSAREIDGWVGIYKTFRQSFYNSGRIVTEAVEIKRKEGRSPTFVDVEIRAAPVNTSEPNKYTGVLYRYGDAYYAVVSANDPDILRTRLICFPFGGHFGMRKRWGIISGCSGVTRLPVAARILAVKRDDTVNIAEISVGEHDENPDLSQNDLNLICNNIKGSPVVAEQEDWILTVAAVIPE